MPLVELPLKKEDIKHRRKKEEEEDWKGQRKNLIIVICGDSSSTLGLRTVSYTRCEVLAEVTVQNNVF
jgi:hypothetical protein